MPQKFHTNIKNCYHKKVTTNTIKKLHDPKLKIKYNKFSSWTTVTTPTVSVIASESKRLFQSRDALDIKPWDKWKWL